MTLRDIIQSFVTWYQALVRWIANGWEAVLTEPLLDWPLSFVVAAGFAAWCAALCAGSLLMLVFEYFVGPSWEKVVRSKFIQSTQVAWQRTKFDENKPTTREAFRSALWCGIFFAGLVLLAILGIGFLIWLDGGEGPDMIAALSVTVVSALFFGVFSFFVILIRNLSLLTVLRRKNR